MTASDPPAPAGAPVGGFVLLEVLIALVIFSTIVLSFATATDSAMEAATNANRKRTLRMLTSRKYAEIRARPAAFKDGGSGGFEDGVGAGENNPFEEYRWEVQSTVMVAAGYSGDAGTEFLFARDATDTAPAAPEGGGKAPDPVKLLRMVLTVQRLAESETEEEKEDRVMRVVAYLPAPPDETGKK